MSSARLDLRIGTPLTWLTAKLRTKRRNKKSQYPPQKKKKKISATHFCLTEGRNPKSSAAQQLVLSICQGKLEGNRLEGWRWRCRRRQSELITLCASACRCRALYTSPVSFFPLPLSLVPHIHPFPRPKSSFPFAKLTHDAINFYYQPRTACLPYFITDFRAIAACPSYLSAPLPLVHWEKLLVTASGIKFRWDLGAKV